MQEFTISECPGTQLCVRIEDLSANVRHQVLEKACAFDIYSIAFDESTDATDTAQLLIFFRGVDNNLLLPPPCLHIHMVVRGPKSDESCYGAASTHRQEVLSGQDGVR